MGIIVCVVLAAVIGAGLFLGNLYATYHGALTETQMLRTQNRDLERNLFEARIALEEMGVGPEQRELLAYRRLKQEL